MWHADLWPLCCSCWTCVWWTSTRWTSATVSSLQPPSATSPPSMLSIKSQVGLILLTCEASDWSIAAACTTVPPRSDASSPLCARQVWHGRAWLPAFGGWVPSWTRCDLKLDLSSRTSSKSKPTTDTTSRHTWPIWTCWWVKQTLLLQPEKHSLS